MLKISRIMLMVLLCFTMAIAGCNKSATKQSPEAEKMAVVSVDEVLKDHPAFAEYTKLEEKIKQLELLGREQRSFAQIQAQKMSKIFDLNKANQQSFNVAAFNAKMAELETIERTKLLELEDAAKAKLNEEFAAQQQLIEDEYRNPLFNVKAKLQTVRLKANEKEALIAELTELEASRKAKIATLEQIKRQKLDVMMQKPFKEAQERLAAQAKELHVKLSNNSQMQLGKLQNNMQSLPENMQNTLVEIEKELINLQGRKDLLYKKMYADVVSCTMKIALEQKFSVVWRDVKVNVNAVDITNDVKKELMAKNNKG